MGFIAAVVGGLLGAAAAAAGAIAATIVSTVAAAIGPMVAAVGSAVSAIAGAVTGALGPVITTVGTAVHNIVTSLSKGLQDIGDLIDRTTKPILEPIKKGWQTIHDYLETIKEGINDKLEPLVDVMDMANTVQDVKIMGQLLTGSEGITKIIKYAEDGRLLDMAAATSTLYNMMVQTTAGILERQNTERKSFNEKITYIDNSMRNLIHLTQSKTLETMYGKIKDVTGQVASAFSEIDQKVSAIGRRTEGLPWFQAMLIRALP